MLTLETQSAVADPRSLSLRSLFLCLLCGQHHAATGTRYPFSCLCEATAAGLETDLETDEVRQGLRPGALVCSLETDLAVVAICSTGTSAPPLGRELCVPEGKPRVVLALLQALILPRGDILSITYVTSNYELQSLLNEWSIPSSKTQDRPSSGAISPCRRRVPPAAEAHHPRRGADSGQLSGLRPPRARLDPGRRSTPCHPL